MKSIVLPGALTFNGVQLGPHSPLPDIVRSPRKRGRPEDDHQRKYIQPLYAAAHFDVNVLSSRRWAKGVTAGIPDLYLTNGRWRLSVWHEAKWNTRQSVGQHNFMQREITLGRSYYVLGQATDAGAFLTWLGLTRRSPIHPSEFSPDRWHESDTFRDQVERWGYREPRRRKKRPLV